MDEFIQILTSLVVSYLPINNHILRTQIAVLIGSLARHLSTFNTRLVKLVKSNPNEVIVFNRSDEKGELNPIYYRLEEYIVKNFVSNMKSCELVPKKGEITFSIYDNKLSKFQTIYEGHKIDIRFDMLENKDNIRQRAIVFSSTTSSIDVIKEYVKSICKIKVHNNTITIYRPIESRVGKGKEDKVIDWDTIYIRTNKTRENTIYSKNVNEDLFDDIEWFMENESWFAMRGIPYKRGYVCYGLPGTGKTSIVKILANKYELPIFMLDLSTVNNNSDLVRLVTEINYLSRNDRYIMLLEDVDRSDLLNDRYGSQLTPDCLLNIMDGVVETHGRICILTANNIEKLRDIPALLRPGRIDKMLELSYCTNDQICGIINIFFPELNIENLDVNIKITPAELVRYMQEYYDNPEPILEKIREKDIVSTAKETSLLEGYKGYIDRRRRRQPRNRYVNNIARKRQKVKYAEKMVNQLPKLKESLTKAEEKEKQLKEKEKKRRLQLKEREKKKKQKSKKTDMILNPKTGRYVKKTGKIGKKLVAELGDNENEDGEDNGEDEDNEVNLEDEDNEDDQSDVSNGEDNEYNEESGTVQPFTAEDIPSYLKI